VRRIRGDPRKRYEHDLSERTICFQAFVTFGTPDSITSSGQVYYELEILGAQEAPQVGFALASFGRIDGYTGFGIGDDKDAWGVDGSRSTKWHDGGSPWPGVSWAVGDVVGLAANVDTGMIAVWKKVLGARGMALCSRTTASRKVCTLLSLAKVTT